MTTSPLAQDVLMYRHPTDVFARLVASGAQAGARIETRRRRRARLRAALDALQVILVLLLA